jgi:hypothetical protein
MKIKEKKKKIRNARKIDPDKQSAPVTVEPSIELEESSKFETHVRPRLEEIYQWMKAGYTEGSIAEQLGISYDTWWRYKRKYSEISELYTRAQDERNCLVLDAMYRKSTGIKAFVRKQRPGKDGVVVDLVEEVYVPPDHNAADLYLRNRMPGYVSTRPELGSGNTFIQGNVNIQQIKAEMKELVEEIKRLEGPAAVEVEVIPED